MIVPLDPAAVCETKLCIVVRTFSEYQTLTGAGLAIVAAFVAARPAWLQLQKMKLQQDIAARSAIVSRLKGIEGRAGYMEKEVDSLLREIMNHLYDFDDDGEFGYASTPVDSQWAHNMSSQCFSIASKLKTHQRLMRDTHRIEAARRNVILALEALADCLDGISLYERAQGDPEISSSQLEEVKKIEEKSREELPEKDCEVSEALNAAKEVSASESKAIRRRLRRIDDAILAEPE